VKTKLLAVAVFWHILLPVSQGLGVNKSRELHCRHLKEIAELFPKGAASSKQMVGLKKPRLGLWDVAPKKVGKELSEKEF